MRLEAAFTDDGLASLATPPLVIGALQLVYNFVREYKPKADEVPGSPTGNR
jgi:hypothetical protein